MLNNSFINNLPSPFFCLAPMYDVTDVAFREIITQTHRPDLFYTEFVNVEGLFSKGNQALMVKLHNKASQAPVIAQIWGKNPENYFKAAQLLRELGFAGIDINMGCPQKNVLKTGSCAALINNHSLASELILATISGATSSMSNNLPQLPVSVKTRIGYKAYDIENWIGFLLTFNIWALAVHTRTAAQMSLVPANHTVLSQIVTLKNSINKNIKIIANGDILNYSQGVEIAKQYKVDGIMIGRGIFKDLWAFSPMGAPTITKQQRLNFAKTHLELIIYYYPKYRDYDRIKKFFKIYIQGFDGAPELKKQLDATKSPQQGLDILNAL